ncbi:MAG: ribosomal protein [Patescibacteria group bacterium]|jgi:ribosomal protein L29|nr:50S ribosomal protein L29 [Candidatus Paceibacterota bacterium]MDQ5969023.1 ribosomal protein [Patescibacteria group bacterium]
MKDLLKKNTAELKTLISEKKLALRNFRFSVAGSNVRNVKEGNVLKKDIARILTILNKKK